MTNTKLLEFYIKKSGLKKAYIAEKIGLSAVGFRNCMVNRAEFRSSHIRKLCELLGIDDPVTVWAVFFANGCA